MSRKKRPEMTRFLLIAGVVLIAVCASGCRRKAQLSAPAAPATAPGRGTLPAGSVLALRTAAQIRSSESGPTDGFAAVLMRELTDASGAVAVTSGSPARLVVLGTGSGAPTLGLGAIMIYGSWHAVRPAGGTGSTTSGAPLGTLEQVVSETYPAWVLKPQLSEVRLPPQSPVIDVPAGYLLFFKLAEAAAIEGLR